MRVADEAELAGDIRNLATDRGVFQLRMGGLKATRPQIIGYPPPSGAKARYSTERDMPTSLHILAVVSSGVPKWLST